MKYIKDKPIDVLFLDIDMPHMNGFELAKELCLEYPDTLIIFMSAYDDFVYDSFDFCPFAYLRKSKIIDKLPHVLNRIIGKLIKPKKQLSFMTKDGVMTFYVKDILYFESKRNYFIIFCTNKRSYECRGSLSKIEDTVLKFSFYRIHSGFLVNLEYVDRIVENSFVSIRGTHLPIAQRRVVDFKTVYLDYMRRSLNI